MNSEHIVGNVYLGPSCLSGDLVIESSTHTDYSRIREIRGGLTIDQSGTTDLSGLRRVGGSVTVYSTAGVDLSSLERVGRSLDFCTATGGGCVSIKMPRLSWVEGNLDMQFNNAGELPSLVHVGGDLCMTVGHKLVTPNIKVVKGYVYLNHSVPYHYIILTLLDSTQGLKVDGEPVYGFRESFKELKGIPMHELALHTGNPSELIRNVVSAYLNSCLEAGGVL